METENVIPINDVHFVAFASLNNLTPIINNRKGRITFLFPPSDQFYQLVQRFYDNEPVPIVDFTTALKQVKAQLWAAKTGEAGGGK